jgi:hypothetical protein
MCSRLLDNNSQQNEHRQIGPSMNFFLNYINKGILAAVPTLREPRTTNFRDLGGGF